VSDKKIFFVIFLDWSIYRNKQSEIRLKSPTLKSFWHAYKINGVGKLLLAWVTSHPLRAIKYAWETQISERFALCEVFLLAGLLVDFKDFIIFHCMMCSFWWCSVIQSICIHLSISVQIYVHFCKVNIPYTAYTDLSTFVIREIFIPQNKPTNFPSL